MAKDSSGSWQRVLTETALVLQETVGVSPAEVERVAPSALEGLSLEEASLDLPEALRAALSKDALEAAAASVPAWEPLHQLLDASLQRFRRGRRCALAVTGQRGTGRGACLDRLESVAEAESVPHTRILFEDMSSEPTVMEARLYESLGVETELETALVEGERRMIVIEQAHHLYVRRIGGFEAFRALLALMAATLDQVMWVVDVDLFAWNYLKQVLNLDAYFDAVLEAPLLSLEDMSAALALQLESVAAEHPLQFLTAKDVATDQAQQTAQEHFFARLHSASNGNLEAAGALLCRSTRWSEVRKTGYVFPLPDVPFESALASLPSTTLIALAMLLEHEALTRDQLSELLLLSSGHTQTIVDTLVRQGIVAREEGCFQVHTAWLAPISAHLSKWNVL